MTQVGLAAPPPSASRWRDRRMIAVGCSGSRLAARLAALCAALWVLMLPMGCARCGSASAEQDVPPTRPQAVQPELRMEWATTLDGPGNPGPLGPDEVWAVPAGSILRVFLRTADKTATATVLDSRGRPVRQRARLYEQPPGVRIDVELMDESPPRSLSMSIRAGALFRTVPLQVN